MVEHLLSLVPAQVWTDLLSAAATAGGAWLVAKAQKSARTANLAIAIRVASQAASDAIKTWKPGQTKDEIIANATAVAKADLLAALPGLEKAFEAECETLLDTVIHGAVIRTVQAPGGSTVTLPSPVPTGA